MFFSIPSKSFCVEQEDKREVRALMKRIIALYLSKGPVFHVEQEDKRVRRDLVDNTDKRREKQQWHYAVVSSP